MIFIETIFLGFKHDRGMTAPVPSFTMKEGDRIGLVCDLTAKKLSFYHNGRSAHVIEGIFGELFPVICMEASSKGPSEVTCIEFQDSHFASLNWV